MIRKVRRESKEGMKRRLKTYKILYNIGLMEKEEIDRSYESWKGHVGHGDCYRLVQETDKLYDNIFEGDG